MPSRAILVGVNKQDKKFDKSMIELGELARACDIEVAGEITQNLLQINKATYIGTGKVPEVRAIIQIRDADVVIFNDELSPSQIRNLENELHVEIMDRTSLILEIFARRAKTREAMLQVEIAHLEYALPRLIGIKKSLEQQTGGVGTTNRGAGEKKLELNRRQIQNRIARLRAELDELVSHRQTQRRQRGKTGIPVVSLVGYTNAGKSTIMNAILDISNHAEDKLVLEKDMLFATLETSVRSIELPDNKNFLLTDTVGFIDKLPHQLIKAFRSTLEEVKESDVLIHVVDCSDPDYMEQIEVTNSTLAEIGVEGIPIIYAMNKIDKIDILPISPHEECVYISAKDKTGIDKLIEKIKEQLFENQIECEMLIPYSESSAVAYLNDNARIIATDYEANGTRLKLECRESDFNKYRSFVI